MLGWLASRSRSWHGFGWLWLASWLVVLGATSTAQARPSAPRAPEIVVLTFGPGDHPFSRFGHNAVAAIDARTNQGRVYNFGTFSFNSPSLISDFLEGRLRYWVSVTRLEDTLESYRRSNRSILAQRLALTPAERQKLLLALETAALPENKFYRYDYYQDNCSTRVRDLLDETFDGALRRQASGPAKLSWREHTSRLTQESLGVYLGLNVALAGGVDAPQTRWEEMFLPDVLRDELSRLKRSGRPVVEEERVWFEAQRPAPSPTPAPAAGWMLLAGVLFSLLLFAGLWFGPKHRFLGLLGWLLLSVLSLVVAFLGGVFWLFWLGTDHEIAHANENLFLFPVWMLAMPVAAAAMLFGRPWGHVLFRWTSLATALSALLGIVLKLLPWFSQDNWMFVCLLLPVWLTLAGVALPDHFWQRLRSAKAGKSPHQSASLAPSEKIAE